MKKNVMVIYGTRPEAIKVAPLIKALEESDVLAPVTLVTGQHREMLDQVNELFGIVPEMDLDLMRPNQALNEMSSRLLSLLDPILVERRPDAVVVQGDTTTVAVAALASFYREIPVVHLEAGLRSHNIHSPFPEEANRRIAGQVTALHLAPTAGARDNLLREAFDPHDVVVTGNTVIDALLFTSEVESHWDDPRLAELAESGRPIILVTTHRRENIGKPMEETADGLARIADRYPGHTIVLPMHRNPLVRDALVPRLGDKPNVLLIEPLDYLQFTHAQQLATLVITDSGGVQEEAPSFGKPVLVLRENTERPEAVDAGTVKLIGTDPDRIVAEVSRLLDDPAAYAEMAQASNPYGDGHASERCVAAIAELLGVGTRLPDYAPQA